jgi:hypothetical protein
VSLAKYLKKLARLEGPSGNAAIPLGRDFVLRYEQALPAGGAMDHLEDIWRMYALKSQLRDDPIGSFYLKTYVDGPRLGFSTMKGAEMKDMYQGRGLGTKAYQALADHYGGILSDNFDTSKNALRVYDKLGAETVDKGLPDLVASGDIRPTNVDENLRRFIKGRDKGKGYGFFDE